MKKVITYGTFDLITAGVVEHLREAKSLGDYLIVGLSTDSFNELKGNKLYLTYEERKFVIEAIKYVDEVITEDNWDQKKDDILRYDIDTLVMGDKWAGDERFESLRQYCNIVYTSYNEAQTDEPKLDIKNKLIPAKKKGTKRVITYGTYDLLTPGHIQHFRDTKQMGDYLIVGVSTDEFNAIKGKKCKIPYADRKKVIEAIKYVDAVIAEQAWDQKELDIKKYKIDILTMGSDWQGDERFEKLKSMCEVRYTSRPYLWSSTEFREHVAQVTKDDSESNVLQYNEHNDEF